MNIADLKNDIMQQKNEVEKTLADMKDVPVEYKAGQEQILQIVIDQLTVLENKLSKYIK
jgi:hypothetical protein